MDKSRPQITIGFAPDSLTLCIKVLITFDSTCMLIPEKEIAGLNPLRRYVSG